MMAIINDAHCCFICDQQFQAGEMVLSDVNEGLGHRACFGDDREGYVKDLDTGEPLGPDDPIPAGEPYDPADYPEFARNAQSEAVAVKALENIRELNMAGADENGHRWANSDLIEQEIVFALTHPAPPLAVTDEMVDGGKLLSAINKLPRQVMEVHDNNGDVFVSLRKVRAAITAALEAKQ